MATTFEQDPDQEQIIIWSAQLFRLIHQHASAVHPGSKASETHIPASGIHEVLFYTRIHGATVIVTLGEVALSSGLKTWLSIDDQGDNPHNNSSVVIGLGQDADGHLRPQIQAGGITLTDEPSIYQQYIAVTLSEAVNFLDVPALPIDNSITPDWLP